MTRLQRELARAADELGLRVEIGYAIALSDKRKLVADGWFPDLSNSRGNLVFRSEHGPDASARQELKELGFGVTTYSEPLPTEQFDIDGYAEMFAEWGWTGPKELKPNWMNDSR